MIKMCIDLHVKYSLFLSNFSEIEFLEEILGKYSNIKFHKYPSNGSRVVANV